MDKRLKHFGFPMSLLETAWCYVRYISGGLSTSLYNFVTKPRLKETYYPSLKKSLKSSGIKFGFNLRQNEFRDSFDQSFEYLSKFKVDWVRTDFPMSFYYEPDFKLADKIVSECQKRKIKLLFVIGSGMSCNMVKTPKNEREAKNFVELAEEVARRYRNKVSAYEIWNEPNLPYFWNGNFKDFIELLRRTSFAMKKASPRTLIGFTLAYYPTFNEYLEKIVSNRTLANIDFFGIHSYPGTIEPGDYRSMQKRIADVKNILKKENCNIQIWVTEIGFVTFNSFNLSFHNPRNQTKFLMGLGKILKRNKISVLTWYRMRDAPVLNLLHKFDPYESRWGLLKQDFNPKDPKIFEIIRNRLLFK